MSYKIKVVTPSGRQKTQSILFDYILMNKYIIDEYIIWVNTKVESDLEWFNCIASKYDFVKLIFKEDIGKGGESRYISSFFDTTTNDDSIYIRLDDDIVFLDEYFFRNIIDFRIRNPEYFLIFGNIVNNGTCGYLHKICGALNAKGELKLGYKDSTLNKSMNDLLTNGVFGEKLHKIFINKFNHNKLKDFQFTQNVICNKRFSINCICWFGKDMAKYYIPLHRSWNEEKFLTEVIVDKYKRSNCICGEALCVHFAFGPQSNHMYNNTNLLEEYEFIRDCMIHTHQTKHELKV